MQDALLLPEGRRIQAVDVSTVSGWRRLRWSCVGCSAQVFPRACDSTKKFNRVPHFYLKRRTDHDEGCCIGGCELLIEKAQRQPINARDHLLSHVPQTVTFRDRTIWISDETSSLRLNDQIQKSSIRNIPKAFDHHASATAIELICRIHAALPEGELRQSMPLNVEGCLGSSYRDVFLQLQNLSHNEAPPVVDRRIFYADLRLKQTPAYSNPNQLTLKLNRGYHVYGEDSSKLYELIIDWKNWTPQLRASFSKDLERHRAESWGRFLEERKRSGRFTNNLILYFLGTQAGNAPFSFLVSDHRKVALIDQVKGVYRDEIPVKLVESRSSQTGTQAANITYSRPGDSNGKLKASKTATIGVKQPLAQTYVHSPRIPENRQEQDEMPTSNASTLQSGQPILPLRQNSGSNKFHRVFNWLKRLFGTR